MKWKYIVGAAAVCAAVFFAGRWSASSTSGAGGGMADHQHGSETDPAASKEPTLWTCPMHPEIMMPEFGDCPKCGMDLVPMAKGDETGPRQLAMSPASVALAGIQTAPVKRSYLTKSIRMVGKIDYDETRVRTIAARVGGRLDRLYVDYTGITVRKGDHLVWLYSPELLTAQQELIEAKRSLSSTAGEASAFLRKSSQNGYKAAREKLLLWGLTEDQVDEVEERGSAEDHILIRSPSWGVVIHKSRNEGDYVQEGTPIYRIADLSQLWTVIDAYEQDLPWLRYGQSVAITTESHPGRVFDGWVSFIDPTVDERTRTIQVRVNVENPDGALKPGMFARALVEARVGAEGHVLEPRLEGKWISPMHPEIVKDGPGKCDVCGMDLVPAESFVPNRGVMAKGRPLVVPMSAVLITGRRAVAYVEVAGAEKPTFEGREVVLGPRAGDHYIVLAGLEENERVVVHGAFRIDSSMQIQAKPSMMSMEGEGGVFSGPSTSVFRRSLSTLYSAYHELHLALADDDFEAATTATSTLASALELVTPGGLPREARILWDEEHDLLEAAIRQAERAESISSLRQSFADLSQSVLHLERAFLHEGRGLRYEAYCPMAFDNQGASWLQVSKEIRNPYFGASMLSCGELRTDLPGARGDSGGVSNPVLSTEPAEKAEPEGAAKPDNEAAPSEDITSTQQSTAHIDGFETVLNSYLKLQRHLAGDDFGASSRAFVELAAATKGAAVHGDDEGLAKSLESLRAAVGESAPDMATLRQVFDPLTKHMLALVRASGTDFGELYLMHCPMAFGNQGADWIQAEKTLANPYFGSQMLRCGTVKENLATGARGR